MRKQEKDMVAMFLNEKPVKALVEVVRAEARGTTVYSSKIASVVDTTDAHAIKVVSELEEANLVTKEREGRKKILKPTDKGKRYGQKFNDILVPAQA